MAIKADMKYNGKVCDGSYFSYSSQGNLGFNINLECEDGKAVFTVWLTEKGRDRAIKTMTMLGADISKLSSQNYLDYELPNIIAGKEVSFGTKEETYQGKTSVRVAWIGKPTDPNVAQGAAKFFGGNQATDPVEDQETPF